MVYEQMSEEYFLEKQNSLAQHMHVSFIVI